jgi:glycosyltransferase involved in cell wall biosynthesis
LTVVLTHPIQYYAPWFRHITTHAPELELTVLHATEPTPEQQGVGFDQAFTWDVSLTDGYRSFVVRPSRATDRVDSGSFTGLDVPEIGTAIERTRPDVVMISGWYSITLVRALAACRRRGVPVLYRGDSHLLSGPRGWRRLPWIAKTWMLLRQFDGYLSPGTRVNDYLRWFGAPADRVFQVPHGVDNEMFARSAAAYQHADARAAARRDWTIDAAAFVPLFVGKLIPSKRPLNVVRAVARLGKGATLLVAGSGQLEPEVRAEAARLQVDLRLVGFLNQTELGKAYAIADCLTLPSDFPETWGLVVNEAMATGLPAVVSGAVGCGPDLVTDDETGYVYPLDDISELANRLERMRRRKAEHHDWAPACRARIAQFSYDTMTGQLAIACRSVLCRSVEGQPASAEARPRILALCGSMVIAGGLERMAFRALGELHRCGAAVHCIVNDWEHFRVTRMAEDAGATWSVAPYRHALTRRNLTIGKVAGMLAEIARVSADMIREARRFKPTHIFVPDYQTVIRNAPALFWLKLRQTPIVVTLQNAPEQGRFYRALWRWLIDPFADAFVCNSAFTERELLAHDLSRMKIRVIPNVVAPRRSAWESAVQAIPGRIIYVGQIIPEKGLALLLDAVARVRRDGCNATLDIVGDVGGWEAPQYRGYHEAIRRRAGEPDLAGAVAFLGWREDVPQLMARASVHCCPSLPEQREAFGLVVLEAKLAGVPSVVLPSGYLPELITHRVDGWVCEAPTAAALADGLQFFLDDNGRARSAGQAARESARRFSPERYAEAWRQVFA